MHRFAAGCLRVHDRIVVGLRKSLLRLLLLGKDGHLIDLRLLNQIAAGLTVALSALVVKERG